MQILRDARLKIVLAAGLVQAVVIGSMFAYGVYFSVLEAEFGWSRSLLSACSSIAFLVMGTLAIVAGRLNDRFGPRWVLGVSGVLFGLGYVLMAMVQAPWQLLLIYGVFIGIGLSTHDVVTLSVVAKHFDKRRGIMTGVVKVGTAAGQIAVPLIASALIVAFGWRYACVLLGILAAVLLSLAAQVIGSRHPPSNARDEAGASDGPASNEYQRPSAPNPQGIDFNTALRLPSLWILCLVQFLFFPSLVTIPVHLVVHAGDLGLTPTRAAGLLSVIGSCSIIGRLAIGGAVDRLGGKRALQICFCILLCSLLWLRVIDDARWLYGFAALYGVSHGGLFTVVSPTVAEYFGLAAHSSIFGVIVFVGTLGGAIGPFMAGRIFDTTGSYALAFTTLATLAATGLLLTFFIRRKQHFST